MTQETNYPTPTPRAYVEDCYTLSLPQFGRGLLRPHSHPEELAAMPEWLNAGFSRMGNFPLIRGREDIRRLNYKVFVGLPVARIVVEVWAHGNEPEVNQTIHLQYDRAHFGLKPLLECFLCKNAHYTLFLRPDRPYFGCMRCLNLRYGRNACRRKEPNTVELAWIINEHMHRHEVRSAVKRLTYRGKPTRSARRAWRMFNMAERI